MINEASVEEQNYVEDPPLDKYDEGPCLQNYVEGPNMQSFEGPLTTTDPKSQEIPNIMVPFYGKSIKICLIRT